MFVYKWANRLWSHVRTVLDVDKFLHFTVGYPWLHDVIRFHVYLSVCIMAVLILLDFCKQPHFLLPCYLLKKICFYPKVLSTSSTFPVHPLSAISLISDVLYGLYIQDELSIKGCVCVVSFLMFVLNACFVSFVHLSIMTTFLTFCLLVSWY